MDQTTDPQISQIAQIKIQFWNLRNLRNLRMGSGSAGPCSSVVNYPAQPSRNRADHVARRVEQRQL
jgi:hypothetical protein